MKNIAVFFGGQSTEHDISIITAMQALASLKNYKVYPIYLSPQGEFFSGKRLTKPQSFLNFSKSGLFSVNFEFGKGNIILKKGVICKKVKIDCALLCNHGHGGEDGSLQGLLELAGIPYTSSAVASSSIIMDKVLTKIVLRSFSINTPAYIQFSIAEYEKNKIPLLNKIKSSLGYPVIVKPARLGSSVGINICEKESDIEKMIESAFVYDEKVIVEKFIENAREFAVALTRLQGQPIASNVTEIDKGKFYSFDDKYLEGNHSKKPQIDKKLENKLKKIAYKCYSALECFGVVRVDFLYDEKNDIVYVNELNNIPGSLAFNLFNAPFSDLLTTMIMEGIDRAKKQENIVYQFNSKAIKKYIELSDHIKYKS